MSKSRKIRNVVRKSSCVAFAIAEEVANNLQYRKPFGTEEGEIRPVLLTEPVVVEEGSKEASAQVDFRFEGGIVIRVSLYDLSKLSESWRLPKNEDWVVTHAVAKYRVHKKDCRDLYQFKTDKLLLLKNKRPWYHPHIMSPKDIKGRVGIFWDNGAEEGCIEVDPDYNQSGFATLCEEVPYCPLISGDKERAEFEARKILSGYYEKDPLPPACLMPDLETIKSLVYKPEFEGDIVYYFMAGGTHSGHRPWLFFSYDNCSGKRPLEFDYEFLAPWISKWGVKDARSVEKLTPICQKEVQDRKWSNWITIRSFSSLNEWAKSFCQETENSLGRISDPAGK